MGVGDHQLVSLGSTFAWSASRIAVQAGVSPCHSKLPGPPRQCRRLRSVLELPGMVRSVAYGLCLIAFGCAAGRRDRERAGTAPSLLPADHSIEQVFGSDDEAAKAACAWLWKNEPKALQFEYCGYIFRLEAGFTASVPETVREATQCPRPMPGPPGATVAGWYHSHRITSDFSGPDKSHGLAIATYLCAPTGLVKKLTPEGTVIVK